jgi:KDO2-lipid IV(A) lauroyltransferase
MSVFVPFFGVQAATITAASRFAAANNSVVIFYSHNRNPDNSGYHFEFSPPLENYPSGDDVADASRINQLIEQAIRRYPEQYLWMHKRFKTQQAGKAARPYKDKKQK